MLALSCRQIPTESFEWSLSQEREDLFVFSLAAHMCTRAPAMGHSEMAPGPGGAAKPLVGLGTRLLLLLLRAQG